MCYICYKYFWKLEQYVLAGRWCTVLPPFLIIWDEFSSFLEWLCWTHGFGVDAMATDTVGGYACARRMHGLEMTGGRRGRAGTAAPPQPH